MAGALCDPRPSAWRFLQALLGSVSFSPSSAILAATAGVIGVQLFKAIRRMFEKSVFPGPGMSFIIRLACMPLEDQFKEILALPQKFGRICCLKTPFYQTLVVSDIVTYKDVMRRRPNEFSRIDFENFMDSVNMAMAEGAMWKEHRRVASRPLTEANLDTLVPMIISLGEDLVGRLRKSADRRGLVTWRPLGDAQMLGMRIASAVYMGETDPVNSKYALFSYDVQDEVRRFIMDLLEISLKPTRVFYHDRLLYRVLFPGVRKFTQKWRNINSELLEDIRLSQREPPRRCAMPKGLPHSARGQFNETELTHTLIMYFGAGGETTASAIVRLIQYFCIYPEIQERARAEATSIEELSATSIEYMPFIEACLMETIRLNPSPPVAIVKALVDCKVAGEPIRKGTRVLFPLTLMLRNEYNDGDEFRPGRWLEPTGDSIDEKQRAEFLGFGFGPRQCPGRYLAAELS
ncbi:hypothetical protein FOZ62_020513 [Perkinsus olseni]|uniref:Cytochrome P450 n=1 Tax=Perkinsus olseni TaxID=32597 RepID=A0A7J6NZJ1_PEROL|nr:hypothetical protein FOZ62_020513 [Perkinsus olseni]